MSTKLRQVLIDWPTLDRMARAGGVPKNAERRCMGVTKDGGSVFLVFEHPSFDELPEDYSVAPTIPIDWENSSGK